MDFSNRILIIDDDKELCSLLEDFLRPEGFEVESAYDGYEGIEKALSGGYSLIVLDVMLPGKLDGLGVLEQLRQKINIPVLMLSAKGEDIDRITGLEMGADDYLPKPFNPRELLARIRTVLRRSKSNSMKGLNTFKYVLGDLELNYGSRKVLCSDEPVELTSMEFDLLEFLVRNAGRVVARDELAKKVMERNLTPYDRSIDVHVSRLRKKLGGPGNGGNERIKAVRGTGYIYTIPLSAEERKE
jgi:two-component system response regulator CpxR